MADPGLVSVNFLDSRTPLGCGRVGSPEALDSQRVRSLKACGYKENERALGR